MSVLQKTWNVRNQIEFESRKIRFNCVRSDPSDAICKIWAGLSDRGSYKIQSYSFPDLTSQSDKPAGLTRWSYGEQQHQPQAKCLSLLRLLQTILLLSITMAVSSFLLYWLLWLKVERMHLFGLDLDGWVWSTGAVEVALHDRDSTTAFPTNNQSINK